LECGDGVCAVAAFDGAVSLVLQDASGHYAQLKAETSLAPSPQSKTLARMRAFHRTASQIFACVRLASVSVG